MEPVCAFGPGFYAEIGGSGVVEVGDEVLFNRRDVHRLYDSITIGDDGLIGPYVTNHRRESPDRPRRRTDQEPRAVGRVRSPSAPNVWSGRRRPSSTCRRELGRRSERRRDPDPYHRFDRDRRYLRLQSPAALVTSPSTRGRRRRVPDVVDHYRSAAVGAQVSPRTNRNVVRFMRRASARTRCPSRSISDRT